MEEEDRFIVAILFPDEAWLVLFVVFAVYISYTPPPHNLLVFSFK